MKEKTSIAVADEDRQFAAQEAEEIRGLLKKTAENIITIGRKLIAVKARLKHGQWGAWLREECEISERMAQNFMVVGARFKNEKFADLNIAPSALYLLAAPSTPEEVTQEVLDRARTGERITHKAAQQAVDAARTPPAFDDVIEETRRLFVLGRARIDADDTTLEELVELARRAEGLQQAWAEFTLWGQRQAGKLLQDPNSALAVEEAKLDACLVSIERNNAAFARAVRRAIEARQTLMIDPEFDALLPDCGPGEDAILERDILNMGCLVAICTWRGIILDGHRRYRICKKHNIPFKTVEIGLPDRDAAILWIYSQQLGRKNLTPDQLAAIAVSLDSCGRNERQNLGESNHTP